MPDTSRSVPKLAVVGTPARLAVPLTVILPRASGAPTLGRTRRFCHVNEQITPALLLLVMVNVSCELLTAVIATLVLSATPLTFLELLPLPLMRLIRTVGAGAPVSNTKPVGALRMTVHGPLPLPLALPLLASRYTGPVRLVNVPPVVSAE